MSESARRKRPSRERCREPIRLPTEHLEPILDTEPHRIGSEDEVTGWDIVMSALRVLTPETASISAGPGDEQSFILMHCPNCPREYHFPQDLPPGGRIRANPDRSIDILDAVGNVVSHTNPPWAYDALGRPVPTRYETDGHVIVQHLMPDASDTYPIQADAAAVPVAGLGSAGESARRRA